MSETIARVCAREYARPCEGIFFNSASWGLVPDSSARESADLTLSRNRTHGFEERELGAAQHRCRSALAELIGGSASEIALVPNTTFGMTLAAALVGSGPPGDVIVSASEFPANVLPWKSLQQRGFRVVVVPCDSDALPDETALLAAVERQEVRALSVSMVQFASGYRADLARLGAACKAHDVLFCVDAIQGLGAAPFRVHDVHADVVSAGGQKWLCAPFGSGFTWIRRELLGRFDPPVPSWLALEGSPRVLDTRQYEQEWRGNARKFEPATLGVQDYLGLARSVEILLEVGVESIRDHILHVHEPLIEWASARSDVRMWTPLESARRAGIISFFPPDVSTVAADLRRERVVFSVRDGAIRFAPHFYNTVEEMERVVGLLAAG